MPVKKAMLEVVKHVEEIVEGLNEKQIAAMIEAIESADRIFMMGAGRSGMASRAFAMRLVQLGLTAYVIGESVTPAMTDKDLLIAVSGSGETKSIVSAAKIAKGVGSKVLAVTSYPRSRLGRIADMRVAIKGRTKIDVEKDHLKHQIIGTHSTLTPLGTLFEDTVMIFFDGIIAKLMSDLEKDEHEMKSRHATLE
ncbi:MAG: 6-phospho-3-hexuloisomerase [Candidatus Altiarchaeales archaeon]|nr:6-phospho-3-hexuloisomerase [Candidatus Altiarchaeota archaeon]MCG2783303.1 6-phospho-3-hexuloisomerase [Candidatus Altiarchaeales archaeon]MBU4267208.1 6-phospho-3-hexuloisomerase [Candidatus Altiarchaeota archaeon]MBU4341575.1 6-phospho-3-hexuloisomerase [Candidatus Altiarchaeota archaeon]MBU4406657.1 6-phospho-3-hexuloisomerase [Candidatus Altiarchaeota archaeon]